MKNTAFGAAKGVVSPLSLAGDIFTKGFDFLNGDTLKTNGNWGTYTNRGIVANSGTKKTNFNVYQARREFGEPETVSDLGRELEKKRPIVVQDFLGGGQDVNFDRHFYERNQAANNSVWNRKLAEAAAKVNSASNERKARRYRKEYLRRFKDWLNERDEVYQEYIKQAKKRSN